MYDIRSEAGATEKQLRSCYLREWVCMYSTYTQVWTSCGFRPYPRNVTNRVVHENERVHNRLVLDTV